MKTIAVTTVQTTSSRLLPCEYVARCLSAESRYFQTAHPNPICAAAKAMPQTIIVIMNCVSTLGPCSEMAQEHPQRQDRYDPDGDCKDASHYLLLRRS